MAGAALIADPLVQQEVKHPACQFGGLAGVLAGWIADLFIFSLLR
jgi:hypothetical protein